jgi:hypothetical protein
MATVCFTPTALIVSEGLPKAGNSIKILLSPQSSRSQWKKTDD